MGGGTQTLALPPGPASPGTWQLLRCQADFAGYLDACVRRHGPLFTLRMPPFEAFVAATEPQGEVRDLLLGLLMAGHETTANSLTWAFERLSRITLTPSRGGRVVLRRRRARS